MSRQQYQSPLFNAVAPTNPPSAKPMNITSTATPRSGAIESIRSFLHASKVAGARDRSLAAHIAQRELELGQLAIDIGYELAAKTLTDQSAMQSAAMDQRLLAKQQVASTGLFDSFAVGVQRQSQAFLAAVEELNDALHRGAIGAEEASIVYARLCAADQLVHQNLDSALASSISHTARRFDASRSGGAR